MILKRNIRGFCFALLAACPAYAGAGTKEAEHAVMHVIATVPLLNRNYDLCLSFDDIRSSPKWDPLEGKVCPLSIERAVALVKQSIEGNLKEKVSGPITITLEMLPIKETPQGKEFGRYYYIIECGISNFNERGILASYYRVRGAVLLNETLANFVFRPEK